MYRSTLTLAEAETLAERACLGAGASAASARSLARATVAAEAYGRPVVGLAHLLDYLPSFQSGLINGQASPTLNSPLPAILHSDADGGIAQLGFDQALPTLVERTRRLGVTLFTQGNGFTTGELGDYARRLALEGLIALAVSNSPAVLAGSADSRAVFGTNPMAFAAPLADPSAPLLIDQASSATAFVNLVRSADEGRPIPEGWAVDDRGRPTTDARAALKGTLLAFGGAKGANVALMVECLAAGVSGAAWSMDMTDFRDEQRRVDAGMTIISILPTAIDDDFSARLTRQLDRIAESGTHVPGRRSAADAIGIDVDTAVLEALQRYA
ncbi:Ldh family oxidoreductase [Halomonas smyrnensis]|uniref:Ldh family oxidoreductase n=1 Tax=Halomonas smyrnensis TaxID=720605 RepID=UPI0002FC1E6D|nr:Ldh family oxidoreductase [Halomonas smyrnensis]